MIDKQFTSWTVPLDSFLSAQGEVALHTVDDLFSFLVGELVLVESITWLHFVVAQSITLNRCSDVGSTVSKVLTVKTVFQYAPDRKRMKLIRLLR